MTPIIAALLTFPQRQRPATAHFRRYCAGSRHRLCLWGMTQDFEERQACAATADALVVASDAQSMTADYRQLRNPFPPMMLYSRGCHHGHSGDHAGGFGDEDHAAVSCRRSKVDDAADMVWIGRDMVANALQRRNPMVLSVTVRWAPARRMPLIWNVAREPGFQGTGASDAAFRHPVRPAGCADESA